MPKFTPGPWRSGRQDMLTVSNLQEDGLPWSKSVYATDTRGGKHFTGDPLPITVAVAYGFDDEVLANARLIAAAPEMFAMIDLFARSLEFERGPNTQSNKARALLAKIEAD